MRIAICDDEEVQRELLKKYLALWSADKETSKENSMEVSSEISLEVNTFSSGEEFIFAWEDDRKYDLIILDIEMGRLSGMELAGRIRMQDEEVPILFVTGYDRYIAQGYEVAALHYLLKPLNREKFFEVLDKLSRKEKKEEKLLFWTADGVVSLPASKIWYLEARAHQCVLFARDGEYLLKTSFGETHKLLGGSEFVQCHRSYLVNVRHVASIVKRELILDDGRRLPMSRSAEKKVNQAFIEFYRR